ncbi:MAG: preprotein translocase subunit SecG [Endomicrobium sp.]|jgi:preprotein translocase subunit SecG|nr:preprotein translocase subunit SecG [Endomicrobium sp.]
MNILLFALKFSHYVTCIGLIVIIVLQAGKSGIVGGHGVFGGGGSDQIFNAPSGIAFINKLTVFMACIFLIISLLLAKFYVNINIISVVQ